MSFTERSGTLPLHLNAVQPDPSAKIHTCTESPQESSALTEEMEKRTTSGGDSDLVSDSDSDSESCSDSDSQFESVSGSEDSLRESSALPLQEALSMSLKDQTSPEETSPREPQPNKPLKENQMCETTAKAKPKLWIIRKNREQNQQQRKNWELCEGLPLHPFIEDSIIEMFSTLRWEVLMINTHCRCQKMFDHDSWSNR